MTLSVQQRDELLLRLDERTHRMDKALFGNGSKGSSLQERVASLESSNNWPHRALYSILPAIATALLAQLGLQLPSHH